MRIFVIVAGVVLAFVLGCVCGWQYCKRAIAAAIAVKINQCGTDYGLVSALHALENDYNSGDGAQ